MIGRVVLALGTVVLAFAFLNRYLTTLHPVDPVSVRFGAGRDSDGIGSHRTCGQSALRYQARMVSGLATEATWARALRPSRLPISAKVDFSGSDKRNRAGRCARRIRFSAAKYSFWRSSSLVDQTGHVGEQTYPFVLFHLDRP